jgi:DNA-binding NarL/FixJ family response regulator
LFFWQDSLDFRPGKAHFTAKSMHKEKMMRPLTTRQQQVLDLLLTGMSNKEIARVLNTAEGTIKQHLNQIYSRLNITTRAKLIAYTHNQLRHRQQMSDTS